MLFVVVVVVFVMVVEWWPTNDEQRTSVSTCATARLKGGGNCTARALSGAHPRYPIITMPRKIVGEWCTQCHVSTLLHLSTLSLKINGQRSVDENQWSVDENQWSMVKLEWSVAELNGQNAIFSGQPSVPRSRTSMVKSKSVVNSPKRNAVVNDEW